MNLIRQIYYKFKLFFKESKIDLMKLEIRFLTGYDYSHNFMM